MGLNTKLNRWNINYRSNLRPGRLFNFLRRGELGGANSKARGRLFRFSIDGLIMTLSVFLVNTKKRS